MKKIILYSLLQLLIFQITSAQVWRPLGGGINGYVYAMCVDSQSKLLYVGGLIFDAGDIPVQNLAIWNGVKWQKAPDIDDQINDLLYYKGQIYAALNNGWIINIQDSDFVVIGAFNDYANCLAIYKDTLYAGGDFTISYGLNGNDDIKVNHIAKFAERE